IKLINEAAACILVNIPYGRGNLKNLEAVSLAIEQSKPVLIIEEQAIEERDFTGGKAVLLYNRLKEKGAVILHDKTELLDKLRDLLSVES
ncbi:MAG: hypothetical protein WC601_08320, partial [Desulfotomaculaceae bacterium]